MLKIFDRQTKTFFRVPGRITGCARLEELTDNWNSTVVFARVESANGRVDFYNLMRYNIKEDAYEDLNNYPYRPLHAPRKPIRSQ